MEEKKKPFLKSSYLLRIFYLSFYVYAFLPLLVLLYLFVKFEGQVVLREQLRWLLFILALASLLLFFCVRNALVKVVLLADNLKKALFKRIDKKIILDLAREQGEVADLAKTFGEIMKSLEENIKDLEETKRTLYDVLSKVGKALVSIESFDLFLFLILETTMNALGAERGVIISLNEEGDFEPKATIGLEGFSKKEIMNAAEPMIYSAIEQGKSTSISSEEKEVDKKGLFISPVICTPLVCRERTWGVLCLSGKKKENNFTEDEIKIISNLSYQIAISLENAALNKDKERTYFETIATLALAVEAKDPYSRGHSERVGEYAAQIGRKVGISEENVQTLKDASRLHDIGKIGIADHILQKEGSLDIDEMKIMKKHPTIGESIVKPLKTFRHLLEPIRHHHEFLDGSGYPDGLKAEEIPLITRILTVADIFDALASNRPYRKALSRDEIKRELQGMISKGKVDKDVVNVLLRLIEEKAF